MGKQAIEGASRGQIFYVPASRVTLIGHDTGHKAGEHPLYDERVHNDPSESTVRNILRYGVKQAVVIRKNGVHGQPPLQDGCDTGTDVLEVIDGRGRTKACRIAAERAEAAGEVPPMLKVEFERSDEDTQLGVMISLNEVRRDDTPMNRVRKAARILATGHSEQEVATMFGCTVQTIRNYKAIIELAPAVHKAIDAGQIGPNSARALAKLSHEEQTTKVAEIIAESGGKRATGERVREKVATSNGGEYTPRLNRRVVKKLVTDDKWMEGISDDAAAILRFLAGDEKAIKKVSGLVSRLKKLSQKTPPETA